jgi:hypothetical protein
MKKQSTFNAKKDEQISKILKQGLTHTNPSGTGTFTPI